MGENETDIYISCFITKLNFTFKLVNFAPDDKNTSPEIYNFHFDS